LEVVRIVKRNRSMQSFYAILYYRLPAWIVFSAPQSFSRLLFIISTLW
jgi:hypothetical protein